MNQKSKIKYDLMYNETMGPKAKAVAKTIVKDDVLVRLVSVWPYVDREQEKLEYGWKGCAFSYSQWCTLAGIPDSEFNIRRCDRLIKLKSIVPDGRIGHELFELIKKADVTA